MSKFIPTMSTMGWVDTIEEKADFTLSWFLVSDYSQSVVYHGSIKSLPWYIQRYSNNPYELRSQMITGLNELFSATFDEGVTVDVEIVDIDPINKPGKLTVRLSVIIRSGGRDYMLGRLVEILNSRVVNIAKLNNG